jgi:hypothetical protein
MTSHYIDVIETNVLATANKSSSIYAKTIPSSPSPPASKKRVCPVTPSSTRDGPARKKVRVVLVPEETVAASYSAFALVPIQAQPTARLDSPPPPTASKKRARDDVSPSPFRPAKKVRVELLASSPIGKPYRQVREKQKLAERLGKKAIAAFCAKSVLGSLSSTEKAAYPSIPPLARAIIKVAKLDQILMGDALLLADLSEAIQHRSIAESLSFAAAAECNGTSSVDVPSCEAPAVEATRANAKAKRVGKKAFDAAVSRRVTRASSLVAKPISDRVTTRSMAKKILEVPISRRVTRSMAKRGL